MAVNFIQNFALANAVTLPGRVPNYRDEDAKLLLIPSYETKESVYNQYEILCRKNDCDVLGASSFFKLWR